MKGTRILLGLALVSLAAAQHYAPKDHITESDIDKKFCKSSHECGYGAVCERVCLWQEYTKKFVGCKIQCVKKTAYGGKKHGYKHKILPFALPSELHVPVKTPHHPPPPKPYHPPKPKYQPPPPPKYQPPPPPPAKYAKHCKTDYDCGYNQHCTYGKECACKYGFHPDPHDPSRCIDLKPSYGKAPPHHPKPHHPKPHHPPPPKASYHPPPPHPKPHHKPPPPPRTCHSEHDCGYGEKCCYWRKCNAYNVCAVEYKCAKYC